MEFRPHQEDAIQKAMRQNGNLLLSHPVGSGKCMRGSTPVLTNGGLVPIASLFGVRQEGDERELVLPPPEGLHVVSFVDGQYVWQRVRALYQQRLPDHEPTLVVQAKRGGLLEPTLAHKLPVIREGQLAWEASSTLQDGDSVCLPAILPPPLSVMDIQEDVAILLAWQIAEGHENPSTGTVTITQDDVAILEDLRARFRRLFPNSTSGRISPARVDKKGVRRSPYITISCIDYRAFLESHGYRWGLRSAQKRFPHWLLVLSDERLAQVLRAFFDAEWSATPGSIELTSASREMICDLQYALLRFGVRAAIHSKQGRATNSVNPVFRTYWRLSFSGEDAEQFRKHVGFATPYKQEALVACAQKTRNPNYGIPVREMLDTLEEAGFTWEALQISRTRALQSMSVEACLALADRIEFLASDIGVAHYTRQAGTLYGIAGGHSSRTLTAVTEGRDLLTECAQRLRALVAQPLRCEPLLVDVGEFGGFVYDLEVDSDVDEYKNFVAGFGAFLVHNTVTAIGAFDRLRQAGTATRALIVTPASLRKNFTDEGVHKFTTDRCTVFGNAQEVAAGQGRALDNPDPASRYHVVSYDLFRAAPEAYIKASGADTVIYDELHKIKNIGATGKALKDARKFHRNFIGLTGSIVSNTPADLVPLIDAMTDGKHHLGTKENFERRFMTDDGKLQNTPVVRILLNPYIHHVDAAASAGSMPVKELETVKVDMSPEQQELYQYVVGKMDPVVALKFRFGTSKLKTNDVNNLFSKMTQARQVSNAIHTINKSVTLSQSAERSPKIRKVLDDVEDHLRDTPDGQVIIYSNMIQGGLDVIGQGLRDRGIDHGIFMGKGQPGSTEKSRTQAVSDYQAGKKKVILLSAAGGEGLNLGNTTFVANVDGHFNPEKIHQAEARGVRAGGQAHRAQADRKVIVKRYVTRVPLSKTQVLKDTMNLISPNHLLNRIMEGQPLLYNPLKRERSPDEWAYEVAGLKDERNKALRGNLDKTATIPLPDNVEDMLDLVEEGLSLRAEDQTLPLVKEAAAKKVDVKGRRLAAERIPMQPHRLIKSDRVVMNAYMKEFATHLEEAVDPTNIVLPEDKQLREQEYIAALRTYYREAAKGGSDGATSSKATTDAERKKEVYRNALLYGTIGGVYGAGQGAIAFMTAGMPLKPMLLSSAGVGAVTGGIMAGTTLWDGLHNPTYNTPAARARKTGKLTDDQMVQLLRGLEVQQKEEKTNRFAVGSAPRATTTSA